MFGLGSAEMVILVVFIVGIFALFGMKQFISQVKESSKTNNNPKEPTINFDKLTELKSLLDKGVLTQEEFDKEKRKILK
jgi:predicted transcriptional regulator